MATNALCLDCDLTSQPFQIEWRPHLHQCDHIRSVSHKRLVATKFKSRNPKLVRREVLWYNSVRWVTKHCTFILLESLDFTIFYLYYLVGAINIFPDSILMIDRYIKLRSWHFASLERLSTTANRRSSGISPWWNRGSRSTQIVNSFYAVKHL